MQTLRLDQIRTDGGTQTRAMMNLVTVSDYAEEISNGAIFPPIIAFYDGTHYWLADGFHRVDAYKKAGHSEITADIRQGTQEDAQWESLAANKTHGLPRTTADKERAIKAAIRLKPDQSSRQIATHIGCSHVTVEKFRNEMVLSGQIDQIGEREVTRNGITYTQNTSNIGKRPASTTSELWAADQERQQLARRPSQPDPIWPEHDAETGEIKDTTPALRLPDKVPVEVWEAGQRTAPAETPYTRLQDDLAAAGESPRAQELHRVLNRLLEFEREGGTLLNTPYAAKMGIHRAAREAMELLSRWVQPEPVSASGQKIITLEAN